MYVGRVLSDTHADTFVRINYDCDYKEYTCRIVHQEVVQPEATWYFTQDKEDAFGTALRMLQQFTNKL